MSTSTYTFPNASGPYAPVQANGGVTTKSFAISGSGATFDGTYLDLPAGKFLDAGAANISVATTSDPATTQTPDSMTLEYVGIVPSDCILVDLYDYGHGHMGLLSHWQTGKIKVVLEREGTSVTLESEDGGISNTTEERVAVRYDNNASGSGGTITFLRNGTQFGATQTVAFKPKITSAAILQVNASLGNTVNSKHMKVKQVGLYLGTTTVTPPPSGTDKTTIYGNPGTRIPLNIQLGPNPAASYALTIPQGLTVELETVTQGTQQRWASYAMANANGPFSPTVSSPAATTNAMNRGGSGATFSGGYLNLTNASYLSVPGIGFGFTETSDPTTTQTPPGITLTWQGILPGNFAILASLYEWTKGQIVLCHDYQTGRLSVTIGREGYASQTFYSNSGLSTTAEETVGVRFVNNASGVGGTITFLRNGAVFGSAVTTNVKPRITAGASFECNASLGNTSNSTSLKVKSMRVDIDAPVPVSSYTPVSAGTVPASTIRGLSVNALSITAPQAAKTLTYQPATGGTQYQIDVVIGPLAIASGKAYRAVLEDWSTGSAVSHANILVMTKASRQNCRFEDSVLFSQQPAWSEWLPQGAVPVINNIAYYCEAIRCGDYTQFQFGYDWTTATMPNNPFGDPTGKESYMVPHKWRIEDPNGVVLATIARPDGGPLNGTDTARIFQGPWDSAGFPKTDATHKWYPHGTVRAGIIWRSGVPTNYDQAFINTNLPRYDVTVPYAGHALANNGFDLRLVDGQKNYFGIWRCMPYEPSTWSAQSGLAGQTQDPWTNVIYSQEALQGNGALWLKYTPFNQSGRSPITGPGGVRDDRVAIADPVCHYMYNVNGTRPHDNKPLSTIALDYLTAYVSDPYHCFEGGRCVPLFKGVNASRPAVLRNHYYGYGDAAAPASLAYYIQGGGVGLVPNGMLTSFNPTVFQVPQKGTAGDKPYFGSNSIDQAHSHQYPHWGSLLFKTPEFAFLGHKLTDQSRLYQSRLLSLDARRFAQRDTAWPFLHAALCWKTASLNSDRLYTKQEILDWIGHDFEAFHDNFKVTTPGFDNPPSNILNSDGTVNVDKATFAATAYFGAADTDGQKVSISEFVLGYWLTALGIGERLGFNAALRGWSAKAAATLDWLIAKHRQRIVGRINNGSLIKMNGNGGPYELILWSNATIQAAGGNVGSLPQSYGAIAGQNSGTASTWDTTTPDGTPNSRDGQAMDQLMAGPSILKNQLGRTGSDLDTAASTVAAWRTQKKTEEAARGAALAGSQWFKYLQGANNPAIS